jgi:AcrR family transcriptional regulator
MQFGTKEHLIEAVVGNAFGKDAGAPGVRSARAHGLRTDLGAFWVRYEALLVANLPLIRTMIGEIHRHAVCQNQALKGIFQPMRAALVARIGAARKSGEARPGLNPAVAADLLAGTIFSSVIRRSALRKAPEYSAADYREEGIDVFMRGIAA